MNESLKLKIDTDYIQKDISLTNIKNITAAIRQPANRFEVLVIFIVDQFSSVSEQRDEHYHNEE